MKDTKYGLIGDVVEIKWRDSNIYMAQCSCDDEFEVEVIKTIGQLIKVDDASVTIAGDVLSSGDVRRVICIPVENIIT